MRGLVAGSLAFAVFFLVQAGVFHFVNISRRVLALVVLWIVGLPVYAWFYAWLYDDRAVWPAVLAAPLDGITVQSGGLLYFFLFTGYAQFFYMVESSVGVRTISSWPRSRRGGLRWRSSPSGTVMTGCSIAGSGV